MTPRDYGNGSVYQRRNGRWVAVIEAGRTPNGKRRRITTTGGTRAEAVTRMETKKRALLRAAVNNKE